MRKLEDAWSTDLRLGDYVSYVTRTSSSMYHRIAKIRSITMDKYGRFSLKVIAVGDRYVSGSGFVPTAYRTTLTSNSTLMVLTQDSVPENIRELINNFDS